jgi:hypothetical protein
MPFIQLLLASNEELLEGISTDLETFLAIEFTPIKFLVYNG